MARTSATATADADVDVNTIPADDDTPVALFDQSVNFAGVSTDYEPCEKGIYTARCTDAEVRVGQQSGQPYINIEWTLLSDPYENRKVWNSASLQAQALWRLKGDMIKMGVDPAILEGSLTIEQICQELVNREADLSLDTESYTGSDGVPKKRNKIVAVTPAGVGVSGYAGAGARHF